MYECLQFIKTLINSSHFWDFLKIAIPTLGVPLLTYSFQKRSFENQNRVAKEERDKEQTIKVFEEVSTILDQRLYRYRQIIYAFRSKDKKRIDRAFSEYREVLFKWNDQLNRNYAMVKKYFGPRKYHTLEKKINAEMRRIGSELEQILKNMDENMCTGSLKKIWEEIDDLNGKVEYFNQELLEEIGS